MIRWIPLAVVASSCLILVANSFIFGDNCLNRCHGAYNAQYLCQCNSKCAQYGNCCDDYHSACGGGSSCQGRCGAGNNHDYDCQCNSHCIRYQDCCRDYQSLCTAAPSTTSPNSCLSLSQLGQTLWDNDQNRLSQSDMTVNYQGHIQDGATTDNASGRLFTTVNGSKLSSPTYAAYLKLLDNYNPQRGVAEHGNSQESGEIDSFLDDVLNTKVMDVLLAYLKCQGTVSDKPALKTLLYKLWFQFYGRSSHDPDKDSSGFEHVMVGEYSSGSKVGGFHSWLSFYTKEQAGHLNYRGYVSKKSPNLVGAAFTWNGYVKAKGTFFIGTSPEFDMAIYTACYVMHKGEVCSLTIGGNSVRVQTHDQAGGHIATAYVI